MFTQLYKAAEITTAVVSQPNAKILEFLAVTGWEISNKLPSEVRNNYDNQLYSRYVRYKVPCLKSMDSPL